MLPTYRLDSGSWISNNFQVTVFVNWRIYGLNTLNKAYGLFWRRAKVFLRCIKARIV